MPNIKLSSPTLWLALFGTITPFACSSSECDGPGGLCIDTPQGDDDASGGTPNEGGAPSTGGSNDVGGAPQGGSGAEGGSPSPGGADGTGGESDGGAGLGGAGEGATGTGGAGRGGNVGMGGSGGFAGGTLAGRGGVAGFGGGAAAGGFGGKGGFAGRAGAGGAGGVGNPLCAPTSSFFDTCRGTSGAGGEGGADFPDWCEVSPTANVEPLGDAGDGGSGGTGGAVSVAGKGGFGGGPGGFGGLAGRPGRGGAGGAGPTLTSFLIDDLEDGDGLTEPIFGGRGVWYVSNDGAGLQFPNVCPREPASGVFPVPGGHAMHTYGRDFPMWAQLGLGFRASTPGCDRPLNASRAVGIRFRAKGSVGYQYLGLMLLTTATNPPVDGGTCKLNCYQGYTYSVTIGPDFTEFTLYFSNFAPSPQLGPFDPSTLLNVVWTTQPGTCFDFWIDDVAFIGYE